MRWIILIVMLLLASPLRAQELQLQVESEDIYANLPFVLSVVASGFEEAPQPVLSKLEIPGCKVTPLGVTPNVSSMVQIINGRRSESRSVSFLYRFRIEVMKPGQYTIPALHAEQDKRKAQTRPARFSVRNIESTNDMQVRLVVPERPIWVGETFDAELEWYLRRDVSNRTFVVPLFDQEEWVDVEAAPLGGQKLAGFHAGAKQLELPFVRDNATLDGAQYTRFRFFARITPTRAGTLTAQPPRVMAELQSGMGRDAFGFAVPVTRLFQAVGKPVGLTIKPPPLTDRPPSFKNAVGSAFSMEVQAGRTVVRVGDPVELKILLRGKARLSGLILPALPAMGLAKEHFAAPDEAPSGELLADGKGKLFRVPVRLRSGAVKQVPALAFSYFDPEKGAYQTVHSQPIALSVEGSAVVGAGDVVGKAPQGEQAAGRPSQTSRAFGPSSGKTDGPGLPLVGADLSLSDERVTLRRARSLRDVLPWLILLYALPLCVMLFALLRLRSQGSREAADVARRALKLFEKELAEAERAPAREAAPRIAQALRSLRRQRGAATPIESQALLTRLETEAYSPEAGDRPLSADLREEASKLARALSGLAMLLALLLPRPAAAEDLDMRLRAARDAYKGALMESDRDSRRAGFARAEALYRELASSLPDRPELQSDWGNAALSAQEPGRAMLAFRRALLLDPTEERARRNLGFLRDRLPDWLPRPRTGGALDSLFFWQGYLSVQERHLLMALLFCIAVLLSAPLSLSAGRRRLLRRLSAVPGVLCAAMMISLLFIHDDAVDAVVVLPNVMLRSADNLGAPPALGKALPAGAEVSVREVRGEWTRVLLWDGQSGWLQTSALERVYP